MPRFNARGSVVMGVGAGVVSVDDQGFDRGGGACWLTDTEVFYGRTVPECLAVHIPATGHIENAPNTVGANVILAGGGVAAWLLTATYRDVERGVYCSTGWHLPEAGLAAVGPDGAVAYTPNYQTGLGVIVRERDGREWTLTEDIALDVRLLGNGRAIWRDVRGRIQVRGLEQPQQIADFIWGPLAVEIGDEWWVLYWAGDAIGLVFHPFHSTVGYLLHHEPNAYGYDVLAVSGTEALVCWASREGQQPGDLVVIPADITKPRLPLGAQPKPEPKTPRPEPKMPTIPNALEDCRNVVFEARRALFPAFTQPGHKHANGDGEIPLGWRDPDDPKSFDKDLGHERSAAVAKAVAIALGAHGVGVAAAKDGSENHGGAWKPEAPDGITTDVVLIESGFHWDIFVDGGKSSFSTWRLVTNDAGEIVPEWNKAIAKRFIEAPKIPGATVPVDPKPPKVPGTLPEAKDPRLKPILALLTTAAAAVAAIPACPVPEPHVCPPPPPCPLPHGGGATDGPDYGGLLDALEHSNAAYHAAQRDRGVKRPIDLGPATFGHFAWRLLREGFTVDQIIEDARERGRS